jgi:hypothetical protein
MLEPNLAGSGGGVIVGFFLFVLLGRRNEAIHTTHLKMRSASIIRLSRSVPVQADMSRMNRMVNRATLTS